MSVYLVDVITVWVFLAGTAILFGGLMALQALHQKTRNLVEYESRSRQSRSGPMRRAFAGLLPQSAAEIESIEQDLLRAGYYAGDALVEYLATRNALIVLVLMGSGILAVLADPQSNLPLFILVAGALTAAMGYGLPRMILGMQAKSRVGRIQRGLPDALDIVRMCITGGMSLRDSLVRVTSEVEPFHPDIAVEFRVIQRHADAGTLATALKAFARRMKTPDISTLAAIVTQTERMGTHVVSALTEYADGIRRMLRQRGEERAAKTSIALLFPVVFCLAPPVFLLLIGPPVLQLRSFLQHAHEPGGVFDRTSIRPPVQGTQTTPPGA